MILTITIEMDNAAFDEEAGTEVDRILRKLGAEFNGRDLLPGENINLRDINGKTVGRAEVGR